MKPLPPSTLPHEPADAPDMESFRTCDRCGRRCNVYNTTGRVRYYRCDDCSQPGRPFTWKVIFRPAVPISKTPIGGQ